MNIKEDWNIILTIAVVTFVVFTMTTAIIDIAMNGMDSDDERPDWANDTARQLDSKGGRIWLYNENGSSATTVDYIIKANDVVYADNHAIIVKSGDNITQYPYDRIHSIYVGGY